MTKIELQTLIDTIGTTGNRDTTGQELKTIFEAIKNETFEVPPAENFATHNLTFTAERTHFLNNNLLTFQDARIKIKANGITFEDIPFLVVNSNNVPILSTRGNGQIIVGSLAVAAASIGITSEHLSTFNMDGGNTMFNMISANGSSWGRFSTDYYGSFDIQNLAANSYIQISAPNLTIRGAFPTFANHDDADLTLITKACYKITGDRVLYQKP